MTVAPQLARRQRLRARKVRECCGACGAATCDASAIARLHCARKLRRWARMRAQCVCDRTHHRRSCTCNVTVTCDGLRTATCRAVVKSACAMCESAANTAAPQVAMRRQRRACIAGSSDNARGTRARSICDLARTMCMRAPTTVAAELEMRLRFCAWNVRTRCDHGHTTTCAFCTCSVRDQVPCGWQRNRLTRSETRNARGCDPRMLRGSAQELKYLLLPQRLRSPRQIH